MADEQKVEITTVSWIEVVEAADKTYYTAKEPAAYEFGNGRKFQDPRAE
jgi:hypothetical protein